MVVKHPLRGFPLFRGLPRLFLSAGRRPCILRLSGVPFRLLQRFPVIFGQIKHHVSVEKLDQLFRSYVQDFRLAPLFLQKLAGIQQNLCPVGHACGIDRLLFDLSRQGTGHKSRNKHDQKRDRIFFRVCLKGKSRHREQKVKRQDTDQRQRDAVQSPFRHDRREQYAQDISHNDAGIVQPDPGKQSSCRRGRQEDPRCLEHIGRGQTLS